MAYKDLDFWERMLDLITHSLKKSAEWLYHLKKKRKKILSLYQHQFIYLGKILKKNVEKQKNKYQNLGRISQNS